MGWTHISSRNQKVNWNQISYEACFGLGNLDITITFMSHDQNVVHTMLGKTILKCCIIEVNGTNN